VDAEQFDQARALVGFEGFQHRADVGFMQIANQQRNVATSAASMARATCATNLALIAPSSSRIGGGVVVFFRGMPASAL